MKRFEIAVLIKFIEQFLKKVLNSMHKAHMGEMRSIKGQKNFSRKA